MSKRIMSGQVLSDKADKTIVVQVETLVKHPVLKKYIRRRAKFMAHDPNNECGA
ncbi:MAG: uS17 family ribosomal protein, partial [Desulfovibrionales bacterium]